MNIKEVTFVTGNQGKWEIARDIFKEYGVTLYQEKIETPEIQSLDVQEVASYSVSFAAEKYGKAVMKSDVGYYFNALNGFPGAFVKFINQSLTPDDILSMMRGKEDRSIILRECLAYAEPNKEPVLFISEEIGQIATEAIGKGSTMDQILILKGFTKPKGACDQNQIFEHFKNSLHIYHDIAKYIKK